MGPLSRRAASRAPADPRPGRHLADARQCRARLVAAGAAAWRSEDRQSDRRASRRRALAGKLGKVELAIEFGIAASADRARSVPHRSHRPRGGGRGTCRIAARERPSPPCLARRWRYRARSRAARRAGQLQAHGQDERRRRQCRARYQRARAGTAGRACQPARSRRDLGGGDAGRAAQCRAVRPRDEGRRAQRQRQGHGRFCRPECRPRSCDCSAGDGAASRSALAIGESRPARARAAHRPRCDRQARDCRSHRGWRPHRRHRRRSQRRSRQARPQRRRRACKPAGPAARSPRRRAARGPGRSDPRSAVAADDFHYHASADRRDGRGASRRRDERHRHGQPLQSRAVRGARRRRCRGPWRHRREAHATGPKHAALARWHDRCDRWRRDGDQADRRECDARLGRQRRWQRHDARSRRHRRARIASLGAWQRERRHGRCCLGCDDRRYRRARRDLARPAVGRRTCRGSARQFGADRASARPAGRARRAERPGRCVDQRDGIAESSRRPI